MNTLAVKQAVNKAVTKQSRDKQAANNSTLVPINDTSNIEQLDMAIEQSRIIEKVFVKKWNG